MPKNVVNKITKTVSKTTKKVNLTYLLAAVIFIGLITALLVLVMRNKEGFKKFVAFDSIWVSKGEKGADGAKGEDAKFEKSFIDENGNPVTEVLKNDQISTEFKNMLMDDMVEDGIIVKEEGTDTNGDSSYFPIGTIYQKTYFSKVKVDICPKDNIANPGKYFNINYTKKSNNSYVKITYTINLSGNTKTGIQFRIFSAQKLDSETINNERQISPTYGMAGVWNDYWQKCVPKSVTITGIDKENDKNLYYIKIDNYWEGTESPCKNIMINGQLEESIDKYNADGYFKSSCTIEEIVLPKDTDTTLSTFI